MIAYNYLNEESNFEENFFIGKKFLLLVLTNSDLRYSLEKACDIS